MSDAFDIAVVGAGASGTAAAISAARAGCSTLLLDRRAAAGGTGGFSGLTTLCGLHDDNGKFLNDGFAREFAEELAREDDVTEPVKMGRVFVQLYRPESFQKVAARMLAAEPRLTTRWNAVTKGVELENQRIERLDGVRVGAVIDCSGSAEVGRAVGEQLLSTDETTQAPSVVFSLANVERDLTTSFAVTPVLLALARAELPLVSFTPTTEAGTVAVKFAGSPEAVPTLITFLRAKVPGFERCHTRQTELVQSRRAGTMIVGRCVLTGADVLSARKFPDAAARGAWPVEQWSADGRQRLRYVPAGEHYEIPVGCLQAAHTENLFMAGKTLSADIDAIASARVMGICLATGAAAGQRAAQWVRKHR